MLRQKWNGSAVVSLLVESNVVVLHLVMFVVGYSVPQMGGLLAERSRHGFHQLRWVLLLSSLNDTNLSTTSSLPVPDVLSQQDCLKRNERRRNTKLCEKDLSQRDSWLRLFSYTYCIYIFLNLNQEQYIVKVKSFIMHLSLDSYTYHRSLICNEHCVLTRWTKRCISYIQRQTFNGEKEAQFY